jgi:hypothetical protein
MITIYVAHKARGRVHSLCNAGCCLDQREKHRQVGSQVKGVPRSSTSWQERETLVSGGLLGHHCSRHTSPCPARPLGDPSTSHNALPLEGLVKLP